MKNISLLLVVGILGLSVPFLGKAFSSAAPYRAGATPAITKEQALHQLDTFNKGFKSMHATLEQTNVVVLVDDKQTAHGEIYFSKKGPISRILFDIKDPSPQMVLLDGSTATTYYPKLKQAQQVSIGGDKSKADTQLLQLPGLGSSSDDLTKSYDVTLSGEETINGKATAILDLKPKTFHYFSGIRLWIDEQGGNPLQIQLTQPNKDYTIYKFINPQFGNVPDSKFDLNSIVPKDVKIQKMG